jgi:hypothetical protein
MGYMQAKNHWRPDIYWVGTIFAVIRYNLNSNLEVNMKSITWIVVSLTFASWTGSANASVIFFNNDLTGFNAASTTSLTNFEGFVASGSNQSAVSFTIDGNTYSNTSGQNMAICGANSCLGSPFDSSVILANFSNGGVRIDLAGGISAVGGLFGDINGPVGTGLISIFDGSGLIDSQVINYGDMGAGLPKTFFGWTSTDTIFTRLEFSIAENGLWSTVDNVQYGSASAIPAPATLALMGLGLAGLGWSKRKKA